MIAFITEHWTTLLISFGVTCIFASRQWNYYTKNRRLISSLHQFFLADSTRYNTIRRDEVCLIRPVENNGRTSLNALIDEINRYVQKSIGTADFNIIQNKTERKVESLFEHATAELSFPTYYGLMGTFLGTFIGLVGFLASGSDLSDENKVTNLILGVLVSMATSLFGLYLTTKSNDKAALAKKQLDERKNDFLDFIQLELIPQLQTTVTTLQQTMSDFVPKFDTVISNFELTFTGVIGRFKKTFDECTANFGTEFRANTSLISETVSTLNDSIGHITDNVENQRKLLEELRSEQMFTTMQKFVEASKTFKESARSIDGYNDLLQSLMFTTQNVIDKQTEYARSLHIPLDIVTRLNELLDRISTFEHNINAVGENIAQSEMLGNRELTLIQRHLESLEEKKQLADRFLDTSNDELETIFQQQGKLVKTLFANYQQQLENERDALSNFVRETLQIISKKKTDLLNHLENAFDVSRVNTMFSHLKTLPEIMAKLEEMEKVFVHDEQLQQHIGGLLEGLEQMKSVIQHLSSDQIQALNRERENLSSTLYGISEQQQGVNNEWMEAFKGMTMNAREGMQLLNENVSKGIESLTAEVNNGAEHIEHQLHEDYQKQQAGINQVAEGTRYLRRDIVKDMSTNVSNEIRRTNSGIQELSRLTERLIRSSSEQEISTMRQLSAEERRALADITSSLDVSGETLQRILDNLQQQGE